MNSRKKILVADDHLLFSEGLKFILRDDQEFEITGVALNGKEAIDQCMRGSFDAVVMDINMPVIDGLAATEEIKRHHPELKVVVVSMLTDLTTVTRALKAGADAYLLKSNSSEELRTALKKIFRNEVYVSESIAHLFSKDAMNDRESKDVYLKFSEELITSREKEVLKLITEGFTNLEISNILNISVRTVDTHRTNVLAKLKLPNTAALVRFVIENKII